MYVPKVYNTQILYYKPMMYYKPTPHFSSKFGIGRLYMVIRI